MDAQEALGEVRRLSAYFCNEDSVGEEHAAAALVVGLPAYWHTANSTSGVLQFWRDYVNINGGVEAGLAAYCREFGRNNLDSKLIERFLERLVPLNEAAVEDLSSAYVCILATWRDGDELRKRNKNLAGFTINAIATDSNINPAFRRAVRA